MSRNNPVGSISEKFPMLNRLEKALMDEYLKMTDDEITKLNKEIESVTETNCSYTKYDIAKSLKDTVSSYCKNYINKKL